jgi:hypothetical protein
MDEGDRTVGDNYPNDSFGRSAGQGPGQAQDDPLKADVGAAREKLGAAAETVRTEAAHFAETARDQASEKLDQGKQAVTSAVSDFADAIRRAGEELGEKDQTMAARLVGQAAEGLSTLSRTVSEKRPEDMLNAVRDFGRANPTAFLAGAVLAGLALGRFARSSAQHEHAASATPAPSYASGDAEDGFSAAQTADGPTESISVLGEDDREDSRSSPQPGL